MPTRRPKGEGTYERLPSGKWRKVVVIEGRKIAGRAANSKAEASANLAAKLRAGKGDASRSLRTCAANWLNSRRKSLSPTTAQTYSIWIAQLDLLGSLPPAKITPADLRQWASRQNLSPVSIRKRLGFIHQILRSHGNEARYKPPKAERSRRRPLTPDEAARLLRAALESPNPVERLGTLLCLQCGLRRSEAVGLKHEDREGGGIRIKRAVVRVTGEIRVRGKTKTASSSGWIPLPPLLLAEIGPPRSGYVLGDGKRPIVPDALTIGVKRLAKEVGVSVPHMGSHALRRSYGMALLEAGVDVVTAADLMRHDAKMLLEEYARTRVDLKEEAIERTFGKGA